MSKKDYERAARIVQYERCITSTERACIISTFVEFFSEDNPHFDSARFRRACVPEQYRREQA